MNYLVIGNRSYEVFDPLELEQSVKERVLVHDMPDDIVIAESMDPNTDCDN